MAFFITDNCIKDALCVDGCQVAPNDIIVDASPIDVGGYYHPDLEKA
jgi:hypothetical protein